MSATVWVALPNNGTEGLGTPIAAFHREDDARLWMESVGRMSYSPTIDLVQVPLYAMYSVKPTGAG